MTYRVRIVRGDRQFEAEGDKAFVLELLRRFEGSEGAATKIPATHASHAKSVAVAKGSSPGEFIRGLGVKKHTDIVLAFGYYLEKELDKKEFTAADLNNLYYEAKIENSNTSQM